MIGVITMRVGLNGNCVAGLVSWDHVRYALGPTVSNYKSSSRLWMLYRAVHKFESLGSGWDNGSFREREF